MSVNSVKQSFSSEKSSEPKQKNEQPGLWKITKTLLFSWLISGVQGYSNAQCSALSNVSWVSSAASLSPNILVDDRVKSVLASSHKIRSVITVAPGIPGISRNYQVF